MPEPNLRSIYFISNKSRAVWRLLQGFRFGLWVFEESGLKHKVGNFVAGWVIKRYKVALKGFQFRARSSQLVLKPNAKRVAMDSGTEPSLVSSAMLGGS
jgi:hypothetical protein